MQATTWFLLQTLMDQAVWNLCPVSGVSSGTSCYYANDQTFTDLTGTLTVTIDDCPDGEVSLQSCFAISCLMGSSSAVQYRIRLHATYPFSLIRHLLKPRRGTCIKILIEHKQVALTALGLLFLCYRKHNIAMYTCDVHTADIRASNICACSWTHC